MSNLKRLLCVYDMSPFVHVAMNGGDFGNQKECGLPIAGVRYVLSRLAYDLYLGAEVVCCFDERSFRKELNDDYKATRKFNPEVAIQLDYLYEKLQRCGINCYKVSGLEADDLVYTAMKQHREQFYVKKIYSTDYDLVHNVDDSPMTEFTSISSNTASINNASMRYMYKGVDILFNTISAYKVFCGDKSDSIANFISTRGVKGRPLYEGYKEFLGMLKRPMNYALTTNRNLLEYYIQHQTKFKLEEEDKKTLLDRVEIVFPRDAGINMETSSLATVDKDRLFDLFAVTRCKSALSNFNIRNRVIRSEDTAELIKLAGKLKSGEYQADNSMSFVNTSGAELSSMFLGEF